MCHAADDIAVALCGLVIPDCASFGNGHDGILLAGLTSPHQENRSGKNRPEGAAARIKSDYWETAAAIRLWSRRQLLFDAP